MTRLRTLLAGCATLAAAATALPASPADAVPAAPSSCAVVAALGHTGCRNGQAPDRYRTSEVDGRRYRVIFRSGVQVVISGRRYYVGMTTSQLTTPGDEMNYNYASASLVVFRWTGTGWATFRRRRDIVDTGPGFGAYRASLAPMLRVFGPRVVLSSEMLADAGRREAEFAGFNGVVLADLGSIEVAAQDPATHTVFTSTRVFVPQAMKFPLVRVTYRGTKTGTETYKVVNMIYTKQ